MHEALQVLEALGHQRIVGRAAGPQDRGGHERRDRRAGLGAVRAVGRLSLGAEVLDRLVDRVFDRPGRCRRFCWSPVWRRRPPQRSTVAKAMANASNTERMRDWRIMSGIAPERIEAAGDLASLASKFLHSGQRRQACEAIAVPRGLGIRRRSLPVLASNRVASRSDDNFSTRATNEWFTAQMP